MRKRNHEFEPLATSGQRPEALQIQERVMGYQTHMGDGTITRILRLPDSEE